MSDIKVLPAVVVCIEALRLDLTALNLDSVLHIKFFSGHRNMNAYHLPVIYAAVINSCVYFYGDPILSGAKKIAVAAKFAIIHRSSSTLLG